MASIQKRVSDKGETNFRVQVRLKGYPSQSATFERLTDAKKWAQKTETEMRERRYFRHTDAQKKTLSDLIDRYLERVRKSNPKRFPEVNQMLGWWKEELGCTILADITKAKVTSALDALAKKKKARTSDLKKSSDPEKTISASRVNRYMAALNHCLNTAVMEWEWLEVNPVSKIKKAKEPRGRVRFLSDEERKALLQVAQRSNYKPLYLVIVLALSTGARKSEILNLKWTDIDPAKKQIILHETKNGERRVLPLAGLAYQLMQEHGRLRQIDNPFLFPYGIEKRPVDIRPYFEKALSEAGIEDFRFHDLRHSAASYMAMNGASPAEIAEVLGHKTLQMVKRYAHLSEAHTHSVVAKMNERIFGNER